MRLICPNCGAQYEVDAGLVPESGRDVQCSNCGHGWFQHPENPADDDDAPAHSGNTPEADGDEAPKSRRELDPGVADVLREEAQRETAARKAESGKGLESQPDLGLDDREETADRSNAARARMARLRGLEEDAPADTGTHSRSELLPDVDEITSTLRSDKDRGESPILTDAPLDGKKRGGFRTGFFLVLLLCVIGVAVYVLSPTIAEKVPQAEPYLVRYVDAVNNGRILVNGWVATGISWVQGLIGGGDG